MLILAYVTGAKIFYQTGAKKWLVKLWEEQLVQLVKGGGVSLGITGGEDLIFPLVTMGLRFAQPSPPPNILSKAWCLISNII